MVRKILGTRILTQEQSKGNIIVKGDPRTTVVGLDRNQLKLEQEDRGLQEGISLRENIGKLLCVDGLRD